MTCSARDAEICYAAGWTTVVSGAQGPASMNGQSLLSGLNCLRDRGEDAET